MSSATEPVKRQVCVCLLFGLPAAGKSTLSRALPEYLWLRRRWDCVVVSYDDVIPEQAFNLQLDLRESDTVDETLPSWRSYRLKLLQCLEYFLQLLGSSPTLCKPPFREDVTWKRFIHSLQPQSALSSETEISGEQLPHQSSPRPLLIVLDDNFYYRSMRYEVFQLARKSSLGFCQVFLECSQDTCLWRNRHRSSPVPDEVILAMSHRIEPPNPSKHPWEQNSLLLESGGCISDDHIQKMIALFDSALDNPLKPSEDNREQKEADRLCCATSVLHQADQACRHLVSLAMKTAKDSKLSPDNMRLLAAELNKLKGVFLEDLRRGQVRGKPISFRGKEKDVVGLVVSQFEQLKMDIMGTFCLNTP
ncbi:L-seryl-tRNA(Sec) kinase-like isoform X1 [Polyodon spathula]|uniref:L-seryl-tRNA(Sec) kinase-like isoform X1 n=1 Tax=Polyodon spathula TaxID=7913 RepID=UPI001B7F468F|nr:L-seryl-tRNA(Sec) kinase-like isoform X1 [Polyodon spathula]